MRDDIPWRPATPRLIAAIAGPTSPALLPWRISATKTNEKPGRSARMSAAAAMSTNPDAASARFQRTAPASAPPRLHAATAATPPTLTATPAGYLDQPRLAR